MARKGHFFLCSFYWQVIRATSCTFLDVNFRPKADIPTRACMLHKTGGESAITFQEYDNSMLSSAA